MTPAELQKKYSSTVEEHFENEHYPRYLYKYRKLEERTKDIIIYNGMYFCSPVDSNDPFDFRLPINLGESIRKLRKENFVFYLNNLKKDLENNNKEILEEISEDELLKIRKKLNSKDVKSIAEELLKTAPYLEDIIQKRRRETGICCFSKKCDNVLMWSHYAQDHKGICFKFDIKEDSNFFSPLITVEYKKEVDLNISEYFLNYNKFSKDIARVKHSDWSYEKEVRVIKTGFKDSDRKKRFLKFKPDALKEIIFGFKTDPEVILDYMNLCKNHNKNIIFFKMNSAENRRFELEKIPIK